MIMNQDMQATVSAVRGLQTGSGATSCPKTVASAWLRKKRWQQ
jgi:hypothetical protein